MDILNLGINATNITTQDVTLPAWSIIGLLFLLALLYISTIIKNLGINVGDLIKTAIYFTLKKVNLDSKTSLFIEHRDRFVKHLINEIDKIDADTNWGDEQYTNLEAKVELTSNGSNRLNFIPNFIRNICGIRRKDGIVKNLNEAILKSKSSSFLVIGEPGSGKTVSLRNLFRTLANDCLKSKNKKKIVPIYLNLKNFDIDIQDIDDANAIHEWVIKQITQKQHRTVDEFVKLNFDNMFNDGSFFFLFDSFDEIPAIMNSDDEQVIIEKYSSAIYRFFNSATSCKGLVCSRPYRKPIGHMGLKIRILPLSKNKIKEALYRYFGQERKKAKDLWRKLNLNSKLLDITKNPFYLDLFTQYIKNNRELPDNNYDLFNDFVTHRAEYDKERLNNFGLTPQKMLDGASVLAYSMINTENIGLNVKLERVYGLLNSGISSQRWSLKQSQDLIDALVYSKFGQLSEESITSEKTFSFAHRRFCEFFCASYLKQIHNYQPISSYMHKDKWREVLVLLCEVLPSNNLDDVFDFSYHSINAGLEAEIKSEERQLATETIRFLKDGFHSRVEDIPDKLRKLCSKYILLQLNTANILEKKKCLEGAILIDADSAQEIFEIALKNDSEWIKETVLISCRILNEIPKQISESIRSYLYSTHENGSIFSKYPTYEIYLSSYDVFKNIRLYAILVYYYSILQIAFYILLVTISLILMETKIIMLFISAIILYSLIVIPRYGLKTVNRQSSDNKFMLFDFMIFICMLTGFFILKGVNENYLVYTSFIAILLAEFEAVLYQLAKFFPNSFNEFISLILKAIKIIPSVLQNQLSYLLQNIKPITFNVIKLFIASAVIIAGVSFWLTSFAITTNNFENSFHSTYDSPSALLITIIFILPIIYIVYLILKLFKIYLSSVYRLLKDHHTFKRTSKSPPHSFVDAMKELDNLETDYYKKQYISKLPKWIDYDKNVDILITKAEKSNPDVSDELFKIAEDYEKLISRNN